MRTDDLNYGEDYFETLDNGDGYRDSTMWEDIAHTIKEAFGVDRVKRPWQDLSGTVNVVDVGCAKGFLVRHLRRRGFDAWGLDISEYALDTAPDDVKTYLRQFDLTTPDNSHFGAQAFRLALCIETMEHIPEDKVQVALRHIYTLLKKHGRAVFTICTDKQPGWDSDPTHVTIKPREWWTEQLTAAGFVEEPLDTWALGYLKMHWLFAEHDGVFVGRRL